MDTPSPSRVPPLRADIRLEPLPGDACTVVDLALGRRIKLDARGATLARALDVEQDVATLATRIGGEPEALVRAIESFARLHLLATPDAERLARDGRATQAVVAQSAADIQILVRPEARFSCTMCGSCCGGHNVGPVNQAELAALEPHLARLEAASGSKKGLFLSLPGAAVGTQVLCHSAGGSCVFLTEDRRCRIHAEVGPTLKPRPCRIFPYEFIATPRGVAVTIQRECRGFAEAREGQLLSEASDELREIAALAGRLPNVRPVIRFASGQVLDWAAYENLEKTLHAVVDDPAHARDQSATLVAMAAAIASARGVPLPEAGASEALGSDLAQIAQTITSAMQQMKAQVPAPTAELLVRADGLDHALDALATLRPDFRRIAYPLERPDQRSLFRDHLHHGLMAKELLLADTIEASFGRIVFEWTLAKALAIHRAREVKRRHLVTQDIMDGLVVVSFLFRHDYFRKALLPGLDQRVTSLFFERLGALTTHAATVPEADTRTELVKF